MAKKVFISSVTQGLIQERTALPGLIRALRMTPVRFEDFTAMPAPSREVCLEAVNSSDVYLLLLGEHYGTKFPDTGLSPTEEEHNAALAKGIPRLAFRRQGITMDPDQQRFVAEVEAYPTGLFRGSWGEIGELLAAVSEALAKVDAIAGRLVFTPLDHAVAVSWLTPPDPRDQFAGFGRSTLEVYLTPLAAVITAARLRAAGDVAARMMRELGGVGQSTPIQPETRPDGGVIVRAERAPGRRSFNEDVIGGVIEGLSLTRTGEVCAWASLPRDNFGAVVDARSLAEAASPLVVLAGRVLAEVAGDTSLAVVPSVAITGAGSVTVGRPEVVGNRRGATLPMSGPSVIGVPGDESAVLSTVVSASQDVGRELAARVEHALNNR